MDDSPAIVRASESTNKDIVEVRVVDIVFPSAAQLDGLMRERLAEEYVLSIPDEGAVPIESRIVKPRLAFRRCELSWVRRVERV